GRKEKRGKKHARGRMLTIIFIPLLYKCPPFKRYCPPGELLVAAIFALIIISQCVNMPMCQLAALYATWPLTN
ncbi:hypothetical protein DW105_14825, partial [Phocaeicola vulgatus]